MLEILYQDQALVVCVKPFRVLSTDEPGGMPDLIRQAIGQPQAKVRTVHRLDQVVGGTDGLRTDRPRGLGALPADSGGSVPKRIPGGGPLASPVRCGNLY